MKFLTKVRNYLNNLVDHAGPAVVNNVPYSVVVVGLAGVVCVSTFFLGVNVLTVTMAFGAGILSGVLGRWLS